jgi:hypothetical protein
MIETSDIFKRTRRSTGELMSRRQWRCFHCDELFTDRALAALHFGDHLQGDPACKLNAMEGGLLKLLRDQEDELQRFRSEDSASARQFYALGAEHAQALRRAEEAGYAKGVADALKEGCGNAR